MTAHAKGVCVMEVMPLYLYKQNEPVCGRYECVSCNILNEATILKLTQPYLSNACCI